jgi:ATP-dependent Clp protease ATP-binding subunit ClpC
MYGRFTDRARTVMDLAKEEAQRLKHEYVGTEHILLALIKERGGVADEVFRVVHIDPRRVVRQIEKIVQSGPTVVTTGSIPLTPRSKKAIECAIHQPTRLDQSQVGNRAPPPGVA